jgi:hypothetical protein
MKTGAHSWEQVPHQPPGNVVVPWSGRRNRSTEECTRRPRCVTIGVLSRIPRFARAAPITNLFFVAGFPLLSIANLL